MDKFKAFFNRIRLYLLVAGFGLVIGAIIAWRVLVSFNRRDPYMGAMGEAKQYLGRVQADSGAIADGTGRARSGIENAQGAVSDIAESVNRISDSVDRSTIQLDRLGQLNERLGNLLAEIRRGNAAPESAGR